METCRYQHQRSVVSYLDLSNLKKGDPRWTWDPGICGYVFIAWKIELWMFCLNYSRIVTLVDAFGSRDLLFGNETKELALVDDYFSWPIICSSLKEVHCPSLIQENLMNVFGPRWKRWSRFQRVSLHNTFWFGCAIWTLDWDASKFRVNEEIEDGFMFFWDRIKRKARSLFFKMTLIRTNWYQIVACLELSTKALGFVIRCAIWCFYKEKLDTHNFRIRRSIAKEENNGLKSPLASKALKKASSNSLLSFYRL